MMFKSRERVSLSSWNWPRPHIQARIINRFLVSAHLTQEHRPPAVRRRVASEIKPRRRVLRLMNTRTWCHCHFYRRRQTIHQKSGDSIWILRSRSLLWWLGGKTNCWMFCFVPFPSIVFLRGSRLSCADHLLALHNTPKILLSSDLWLRRGLMGWRWS
jgi:hypothetical protein